MKTVRRPPLKVKLAFRLERRKFFDFALPAGSCVKHVAVTTDVPIAVRFDIKTITQINGGALLFKPCAHARAIAEEQVDDLRTTHNKARQTAYFDAFRAFFLNPAHWCRHSSLHRRKWNTHNNALLNCQLREFDAVNGGRDAPRGGHQRENQRYQSLNSITALNFIMAERCVSTVEPAINPDDRKLLQ